MESQKKVEYDEVITISKYDFLKIIAETMSEMTGPEPETLDELREHVLWVENIALFASILTYNVFGDE